jgi:hypothetical protein
MKTALFAVFVLLAGSVVSIAGARVPASDRPDCEPHRRLDFYEPLYGVYQFTQGDDSAARLHYSFRYTAKCSYLADGGRKDWFFSYTGEFDFYMFTRPSGPVVNRISNPAFHLRRWSRKQKEPNGLQYWDVAVEHRSNGQTVDATQPDGRVRAQRAYEDGDNAFLDSISQATNFLSVEARFDFGDNWRTWSKVKPVYFATSTDITWGPWADKNTHIRHYDVLRLIVARKLYGHGTKLPDQSWLYAEWTAGTKGLYADSLNLSAHFPFKVGDAQLPFFVRAHFGPLHTLSSYPRSQTSLGFGFLFLN